MYVLTPYEVLRRNGADVQKGKAYRWVESSEAGEAKKAVEGSPSGPEWAELPHEFGGSRLPLGRVAAGGQNLEANFRIEDREGMGAANAMRRVQWKVTLWRASRRLELE